MELFFIHNEWNDICILENNIITRKNIIKEKGYYYYEKNNLIIKWDLWNDINIFKKFNNIYIDIKINVSFINIFYKNKQKKYYLLNNQIFEENSFHSIKNRKSFQLKNKNNTLIIKNNENDELEIFYKNNI